MAGEGDTPSAWADDGGFRVEGPGVRARVAAAEPPDTAESLRLLRLAQHRFDALSLLTGQLLWATDAAGNVGDNPSWRAYTGQSREEVRGLGWARALHPGDQARTVAAWLSAVGSGGPYQVEYRLRRHDGVYRWFLARGAPVRDDAGIVVEWVGMSIDIDSQKRAETKLADANHRTTRVLENISDAFFAVDRAWRFTYVNGEAENLLRTTRDRLLGHSLWEAFPEAVGTAFHAEYRRAVAEHTSVAFEEVYPPLGKWFAVRAYPTHDGLAVYFQDVSNRRAAEQERHRLAQRTQDALSALLEMAEQVVAAPPASGASAGRRHRKTVDVIGQLATLAAHVLGCERVGIHTLEGPDRILRPVAVSGLTPREQRRWWRRYADHDHPLGAYHEPDVVARLRNGDAVLLDAWPHSSGRMAAKSAGHDVGQTMVAPLQVGSELVGILAAGAAASPHTYTQAEIDLAAGVARLLALVLERERLLREREEARSRKLAAVEANRRMDEFLAIAGHEMRTPITIVKTNAQLLARGTGAGTALRSVLNHGLTDAQARMLARMETAADRLNRLVADLLDVSRIREGKLQLDLHPCDVTELLRDAVEEQRQTNSDRTILLEDAPDEPLVAHTDAGRIAQVFVNYLTNALKYAPPEAPIRVRLVRVASGGGTGAGAGAACIAVRDEGPGLSLEQQRHLWERFYRVPGVEVRSGSGVGLGLGLYICREIVERHGGAVGVESAPGAGSTFWLTLPLAGDTAQV